MRNLNDPRELICGRAGLEDVRIHDCRHPHASQARALGESLPMIGKLLERTQAETTARYGHPGKESVPGSAVRVSESIADDLLPGRPGAAAIAGCARAQRLCRPAGCGRYGWRFPTGHRAASPARYGLADEPFPRALKAGTGEQLERRRSVSGALPGTQSGLRRSLPTCRSLTGSRRGLPDLKAGALDAAMTIVCAVSARAVRRPVHCLTKWRPVSDRISPGTILSRS